MPEMTFTVRWPDGEISDLYSPSLVIHDHLSTGETYSIDDFTAIATNALAIAGDRVRQRFGFACTSAMATSDSVRSTASRFAPDARVQVLAMEPPLNP